MKTQMHNLYTAVKGSLRSSWGSDPIVAVHVEMDEDVFHNSFPGQLHSSADNCILSKIIAEVICYRIINTNCDFNYIKPNSVSLNLCQSQVKELIPCYNTFIEHIIFKNPVLNFKYTGCEGSQSSFASKPWI